MSDDQPPKSAPKPPKPNPPAKDEREARLAAALRANLRRRKASAKGKQD